MNRIDILETFAAFCLGFSLSGIFGLLNGIMLSIAILIFYHLIEHKKTSLIR